MVKHSIYVFLLFHSITEMKIRFIYFIRVSGYQIHEKKPIKLTITFYLYRFLPD